MRSQSFFTSDQRSWPNARAFDELRSHLVTVGKIDQMRSAFWANAQRNWPNAAQFTKRCVFGQMTNWSNALHIWPNAQIGQMHLTYVIVFTYQ